MAKMSKFESIWGLMSDYFGNMKIGSEFDKFTCAICKKLVIDAVVSNVCGCQFCFRCISGYLNGQQKHCPGGKEHCSDEDIVIDKNAFRCAILNKNIWKLRLKCPNQACEEEMELLQLVEHMKSCSKQSIDCPYIPIGCYGGQITIESLTNHLNKDVVNHTELLIDLIQNLRNEVTGLREDFERSKQEIERLKEDSLNKENRIVTLEEELSILRTGDIEKMRNKILEQCTLSEVEEIKIKNIMTMLKNLKTDMNAMMQERQKINDDRERRINKLIKMNKLCPSLDADFVWRIEDCRKTVDTAIFSESFYSNNYKFCLYMRIGNDDNVGLGAIIMRGDNDGRLEWPMRRSVTLSIIDQDSLRAHKTVVYRYDTYQSDKSEFDRPTTDKNKYGIGSSAFIKYSSIKDKSSIIFNRSIIISCLVQYD